MSLHKNHLNMNPFMNPNAHFITPGSVNFIPAWILLLIAIFTYAFWFPKNFAHKNYLISPLLAAFILGSLMPAFDDLFTYLFGPPFAHHSLFHSITTGPIITYALFFLLTKSKKIAKYAVIGNLAHTFFNFYFDSVTLFFPFSLQEFGLGYLTGIPTYIIKTISYPILLILFFTSLVKYFKKNK